MTHQGTVRLRTAGHLTWLHVRDAVARTRAMARRHGYRPVVDLPPIGARGERGRALLSYLAAPLSWADDAAGFRGHTNAADSAEIGRIFRRSGYRLDAIDWNDGEFVGGEYDLMLDIHGNLPRFRARTRAAVLHATGSHPRFSNAAELARIDSVAKRRGVRLRPRRQVAPAQVDAFDESLERADLVTLIGNRQTFGTFPRAIAPRIRTVATSGAILDGIRTPEQMPAPTEFLWFNGSGAVHKGLDLVLEVFARHPSLTLHCVGPYERELDFVRAYRRELYDLPNVHSHGFVLPSSDSFRSIAGRCAAFVSPSCSEGISTSAITCLQFGLLPIVTPECGIDVAEGDGWVVADGEPASVEQAVLAVADQSRGELSARAARTQADAMRRYSRQAFADSMTDVISGLVR